MYYLRIDFLCQSWLWCEDHKHIIRIKVGKVRILLEFYRLQWQFQIFLPKSLNTVVVHLKSFQVIPMGFHEYQIGFLTFAAKFYDLV